MTRKDYVLIAESLRMALAQCRMLPGEAATYAVIGAERAAHAIACDLVWSAKVSPQVHSLTPEQAESRLRTMVDNGDYCANLFSFGFECDYAVPVNTEAMELFAMHYTGQWQDRRR